MIRLLKSRIAENLLHTAAFGLIGLATLWLLSRIGPLENRIADNLLNAAGFGLIGLVMLWLLSHWRSIGHRLLLLFTLAFCWVRSLTSILAAWSIYKGQSAVLDRNIAAFIIVAFAMHIALSKDDILVTLRTSEAEDRIRKDKMADQLQARLTLEYLAVQTQEKSAELVSDASRRRKKSDE